MSGERLCEGLFTYCIDCQDSKGNLALLLAGGLHGLSTALAHKATVLSENGMFQERFQEMKSVAAGGRGKGELHKLRA